jgi:hypothetical protein
VSGGRKHNNTGPGLSIDFITLGLSCTPRIKLFERFRQIKRALHLLHKIVSVGGLKSSSMFLVTSSEIASDKFRIAVPLMLPDELQDIAVEGLGLLPVDRVSCFGQHDELGAGDMGELPPHDPGRRLQVLISGHQQRRHPNTRELFEGAVSAVASCLLTFGIQPRSFPELRRQSLGPEP